MLDYNAFILSQEPDITRWPEPECPEDLDDYVYPVTVPSHDDWHLEPTPYVDGDPF